MVCPSLTFYATAESIVNAGARPVFCDVDLETCCITAETVRPHLSSATRAVVAVHLFGNVAPMAELRELGLPVIEDAARAAQHRAGVKAGALGEAATFSFFPSKNLPCLGDGGAIATASEELADQARAALPWLARQADAHRRGLQLAARRAPGGGVGSCSASSTGGTGPAARRRGL